MSLVEFLKYAGTAAGINVIIGFLLSFVLEWFPEYETLASRWKRIIAMGMSFVIPVLSILGLWLTGNVALTLDVVWLGLSAGFAAFFGSQMGHARELSVLVKSSSARDAAAREQYILELAGEIATQVSSLWERYQGELSLTDKGVEYLVEKDSLNREAFEAEGEMLFGESEHGGGPDVDPPAPGG